MRADDLLAKRARATPVQRSLQARIAANTRWAHEPDRTAATRPARAAAVSRFEREVDPDGVLPPAERARRADSAQRAHMQRLALRSSRARAQAARSVSTARETPTV
jgi:hypothetical protein